MMKGDNIYLRALEPSDTKILYDWENDCYIWQFGSTITPYSEAVINIFIKNSIDYDIYAAKQLRLMICKNADTKAVGCIDLYDFDPLNRRAAVGIFITKKEQQKGYASEALKTLINYAFNILNLKQLYCNIIETNTTSIKLFTAQNFVQCGVKKQWLLYDGQWFDELCYQLINN
ncbi:MAG: GNAT family protein [Bacteroidales bacterium]|jgi:diamine N-acetyltransferase|nr:GNAT family protein [Bacteroidales bacterium]